MHTLYYKLDLLGEESDPNLALIDDLVQGRGLAGKSTAIIRGNSVQSIWPGDAWVRIGKRYGDRLSDLVGTTNHTFFASKRLAELVRNHLQPSDQVEFLPITILDRSDRVLSRDYFVINPVGTVDCLDLNASEVDRADDKSGQILRIEKLVLSSKKLKTPRSLFRVQGDPTTYVLSTPLAEAIREDDTPNVFWKKLQVT